jgi:hypothetical protein
MNSLELRKYLGSVKMKFVRGEETKEKTLQDLQSIDWTNIEEFEACPVANLQTFAQQTIDFVNSR